MAFNNSMIINAYGPTEATVATMFAYCTKDMLKNENEIPIGMDKKNGDVLLINKMKPSQHGEIVIVGDQVSSGYLNANPGNQKNFFYWMGKRAYYTGDYGFIQDG